MHHDVTFGNFSLVEPLTLGYRYPMRAILENCGVDHTKYFKGYPPRPFAITPDTLRILTKFFVVHYAKLGSPIITLERLL